MGENESVSRSTSQPKNARYEVFVKFGDFQRIAIEYSNFKRYVQPFLGGGRNIAALDMRRTPRLGGIIYSLLGTINDQLVDFSDFYHRADIFQIRDVLTRLFQDSCRVWYANRSSLEPVNITAEYQSLLEYIPDGLEQIVAEQLQSVRIAGKLTFERLGNKRSFTNPWRAVQGKSLVRSSYLCITHGDFNQHNLLVDSNRQIWMIDFQGTGPSHILRDVAALDSIVRFQLLTAGETTLRERLLMEEALCSIDHFSQLEQLEMSFSTTNLALAKCFATVIHLRKLARWLVEQNLDDISEYSIALFYNALNTIRFSSLKPIQREHAILCASLLADQLKLGGQDEALRDKDTRVILSAIGDKSFNNHQQLAEGIMRRLEATNPTLIESPYFEYATIWEISLPEIGLRLRTQRAILLLRQSENGNPYEQLSKIIGKKEPDFIIVVDVMNIRSIPFPSVYRMVWFRPETIREMVSLPKEDLLGWLGRFITTQVDVRPLLPYQTKGATELFFGRDYELMRLIGGNLHGGIIIGAHRSGKTSLLYKIGERLRQRGFEVVGPITFPRTANFQYFFERTLDPLNIDCPIEMTPESWSSALRVYSKEKDVKPIFLLDEVDNLLMVDSKSDLVLGQHMRSLQSDGFCEFYLAGHARLREAIVLEESPFRNFAEEIVLAGLTEQASMSLIQEPMKIIGFHISDAQSFRIIKGTAGVPVLCTLTN